MDKTSHIQKSTQAHENNVRGGCSCSDLADFQSGKEKNFANQTFFSDSTFCQGNALYEAGRRSRPQIFKTDLPKIRCLDSMGLAVMSWTDGVMSESLSGANSTFKISALPN